MRSNLLGRKLSIVVPCGFSQDGYSNLKKWVAITEAREVEVILVIDTDITECQREIQNIKKLRQGVKIVVSKSRNPGGSRNIGFQSATREWVMFCDSDDFLYVDRTLDLLDETIKKRKKIGVGQFMRVLKSEQSTQRFLSAKIQDSIMDLTIAPGIWRYIFLRERIENFQFLNLSMGEDQVFLASINMKSEELHFSKEVIYEYFIGSVDQLTNKPALLSDLLIAVEHLVYELKTQSIFSRQVVIRFLVTGVKHASLSHKMTFLLKLLRIIKANNISLYKNLFVAIFHSVKFNWKSKNFSEVVLTGGLGNQLFQIAYALKLGDTRPVVINTTLGAPRLNHNNQPEVTTFNKFYALNKNSYSPSKIRSRLLNYSLRSNLAWGRYRFLSLAITFFSSVFYSVVSLKRTSIRSPRDLGWDPNILQIPKSTLVIGYFQTFVFANSTKVFKFMHDLEILDSSQKYLRLKKALMKEQPLIVHIRLGDYKANSKFGILDPDYYKLAINKAIKLKNYKSIWLFSDESESASEFLNFMKKIKIRVIHEDTLSASETLQLMRHGSGFVIGNSSFSWWAAYLRMDSNAPVFAPFPWFRLIPQPSRLYPSKWYKIKSKFN